MEVDVLKEALNLLKKDHGINVTELKNREKAYGCKLEYQYNT